MKDIRDWTIKTDGIASTITTIQLDRVVMEKYKDENDIVPPIENDTFKPNCLGGFGDINFGKQYRQGNRVYSSEHIAMALNASPVGNMGGYSYLYVVRE